MCVGRGSYVRTYIRASRNGVKVRSYIWNISRGGAIVGESVSHLFILLVKIKFEYILTPRYRRRERFAVSKTAPPTTNTSQYFIPTWFPPDYRGKECHYTQESIIFLREMYENINKIVKDSSFFASCKKAFQWHLCHIKKYLESRIVIHDHIDIRRMVRLYQDPIRRSWIEAFLLCCSA